MKEIDAAYRAKSGISDRRYYKSFYSHIHPFPLLVLGHNPGGQTDGTDLSASDKYFEGWEHDYLHFRNDTRYKLARPMCALLEAALQTRSEDILRQVPATNVVFRRSNSVESLDVSPRAAAEESRPMLRRILVAVNPMAILLVAKTAYDLFKAYHCEPSMVTEDKESFVFTRNGRTRARIFLSARAHVLGLNRELPLFVVGHPSKYAGRKEWPQVEAALGRGLQESGVAPIDKCSLVPLKPYVRAFTRR